MLAHTKKTRAATGLGAAPRKTSANATSDAAARRNATARKRVRGNRDTIADKSGDTASVAPSVTRKSFDRSATLPAMPIASRTGRTAYQLEKTKKNSPNDHPTAARSRGRTPTPAPCARPATRRGARSRARR